MSLRVVEHIVEGELYGYSIEDVEGGSIVNHRTLDGRCGLCFGVTVADLRKNLRAMLAACDTPPLRVRPAELVEAP